MAWKPCRNANEAMQEWRRENERKAQRVFWRWLWRWPWLLSFFRSLIPHRLPSKLPSNSPQTPLLLKEGPGVVKQAKMQGQGWLSKHKWERAGGREGEGARLHFTMFLLLQKVFSSPRPFVPSFPRKLHWGDIYGTQRHKDTNFHNCWPNHPWILSLVGLRPRN